jgi:hypothetical protein
MKLDRRQCERTEVIGEKISREKLKEQTLHLTACRIGVVKRKRQVGKIVACPWLAAVLPLSAKLVG